MAKRSITPHLPPAVRRQVNELGEMIRIARRERGWTQQELANRIGVGRMTVARMEKGAAEVSVGACLCASWLLDLPVLTWSETGTGGSVMGSVLNGLRQGTRRPHPRGEK